MRQGKQRHEIVQATIKYADSLWAYGQAQGEKRDTTKEFNGVAQAWNKFVVVLDALPDFQEKGMGE